ncbi:MAG: DNA polymerase III subunit delta [Planctomycetota bacterium]
MLATEFLADKAPFKPVPVVAMYGPERYFRTEILKRIPGLSGEDAESSLTRLQGPTADFRSVISELKTVSMFGDARVVLIEDADTFVSANRSALEKYVQSPSRTSILILDVKAWKKTEKLCKLVEQHGLNLECNELSGAALTGWMQKLAKEQFGKKLDRESAALILTLAGEGLSMLSSEIAKLASLVGEADSISKEDVAKVVGGWRMETTWNMLDAVRDGQPARALQNLEKLLKSGESPIKILAGVTYSFRKFAEATELARQRQPLREALINAGVFPASAGPAEHYLKRMGFERASRILQWLMEADADMKGGSRVDPAVLLERLFIRLAGEPVGAG